MILIISLSEECRIFQDFLIVVQKTRDLSNNSNDGETSKKTREDSLNTSTSVTSDIRDDLFTESLKEPDCVAILLNCIKKMEKQITQIFDNTNKLKEKQIKGESHLQELSDAADFVTKKFDKYEHESKKREEIINNLMENVAKLTQKSRYPLRSCGKTRAVFEAQLPATSWNSQKETRKC